MITKILLFLSNVITANNIQKKYGDLEVLRGVNLTIGKGELISIVGASGAGKSTLLHILGTLDSADQGDVIVDNIRINTLKGKKLAQFRNEKIGFIFQFHHLLPEFTALENICIPAYIQKMPKQRAERKATELLEYLGLKDRMEHKPSQLSGGEQQRVAVARALINNPAVVMADEPSGNLDSENSKELHQLFFDLRDKFNQTFVIVTHNDELANLSDKKLVMKDGLIV